MTLPNTWIHHYRPASPERDREWIRGRPDARRPKIFEKPCRQFPGIDHRAVRARHPEIEIRVCFGDIKSLRSRKSRKIPRGLHHFRAPLTREPIARDVEADATGAVGRGFAGRFVRGLLRV